MAATSQNQGISSMMLGIYCEDIRYESNDGANRKISAEMDSPSNNNEQFDLALFKMDSLKSIIGMNRLGGKGSTKCKYRTTRACTKPTTTKPPPTTRTKIKKIPSTTLTTKKITCKWDTKPTCKKRLNKNIGKLFSREKATTEDENEIEAVEILESYEPIEQIYDQPEVLSSEFVSQNSEILSKMGVHLGTTQADSASLLISESSHGSNQIIPTRNYAKNAFIDNEFHSRATEVLHFENKDAADNGPQSRVLDYEVNENINIQPGNIQNMYEMKDKAAGTDTEGSIEQKNMNESPTKEYLKELYYTDNRFPYFLINKNSQTNLEENWDALLKKFYMQNRNDEKDTPEISKDSESKKVGDNKIENSCEDIPQNTVPKIRLGSENKFTDYAWEIDWDELLNKLLKQKGNNEHQVPETGIYRDEKSGNNIETDWNCVDNVKDSTPQNQRDLLNESTEYLWGGQSESISDNDRILHKIKEYTFIGPKQAQIDTENRLHNNLFRKNHVGENRDYYMLNKKMISKDKLYNYLSNFILSKESQANPEKYDGYQTESFTPDFGNIQSSTLEPNVYMDNEFSKINFKRNHGLLSTFVNNDNGYFPIEISGFVTCTNRQNQFERVMKTFTDFPKKNFFTESQDDEAVIQVSDILSQVNTLKKHKNNGPVEFNPDKRGYEDFEKHNWDNGIQFSQPPDFRIPSKIINKTTVNTTSSPGLQDGDSKEYHYSTNFKSIPLRQRKYDHRKVTHSEYSNMSVFWAERNKNFGRKETTINWQDSNLLEKHFQLMSNYSNDKKRKFEEDFSLENEGLISTTLRSGNSKRPRYGINGREVFSNFTSSSTTVFSQQIPPYVHKNDSDWKDWLPVNYNTLLNSSTIINEKNLGTKKNFWHDLEYKSLNKPYFLKSNETENPEKVFEKKFEEMQQSFFTTKKNIYESLPPFTGYFPEKYLFQKKVYRMKNRPNKKLFHPGVDVFNVRLPSGKSSFASEGYENENRNEQNETSAFLYLEPPASRLREANSVHNHIDSEIPEGENLNNFGNSLSNATPEMLVQTKDNEKGKAVDFQLEEEKNYNDIRSDNPIDSEEINDPNQDGKFERLSHSIVIDHHVTSKEVLYQVSDQYDGLVEHEGKGQIGDQYSEDIENTERSQISNRRGSQKRDKYYENIDNEKHQNREENACSKDKMAKYPKEKFQYEALFGPSVSQRKSSIESLIDTYNESFHEVMQNESNFKRNEAGLQEKLENIVGKKLGH